MMKMIFGNALMSILDFELTNSNNASACTTGFSRPMPMSVLDLQSLPKTADVVMMELVGLSINQIEICCLCNTSNSLAGKYSSTMSSKIKPPSLIFLTVTNW